MSATPTPQPEAADSSPVLDTAAAAVAEALPVAESVSEATPAAELPADDAVAVTDAAAAAEDDEATAEAEPTGTVAAPAAARASIDHAAVAQAIKARFPLLFTGSPKPVKLRIQADIQAAAPGEFSKPALSAFLRRHTGSTSYLLALAKSAQRYDLAGQPAGEVSDEHRQVANEELERRRNLTQERRALEDQQRALEGQQRYNRAGLLRDFEKTTLTRANFCALKDVPEDKLDALLDIARREAAEDAAAPRHFERDDRRPPGRGGRPGRDEGRGDARGPRGPSRGGPGRPR